MDSFEWNKIIGAVLFALLVGFGVSALSEAIFESEEPESPGYVIAVATEGEGEAGGAGEAAEEPIAVLLASADPAAGETSAKKCVACHTFEQGGANKVGPNLWSIVMRPIASHAGYEYSDAMHSFAEQAADWTYDHLSSFLANPKGVVPGTKMAFPGVKTGKERANILAYLRTLSDSPAPLPTVEASAAPAGTEAPAAGAAPAAAEGAAADETAAPATGEPAAAPTEAPAAAESGENALQPDQTGDLAPPAAAEGSATTAPEQQVSQAEPSAPAPAGEQPSEAQPAAPAEEQGGPAPSGFAAQVAAADPAAGETFAKRCAACHTFEQGGANKVGPPLYGVVNRPIASIPDYAYSDAMVAFSEGGSKVWDYDTLHTYLEDPRGSVPGTKMIFPGVKSEEDRANVIAYLRTLAEQPASLAPAQ
jgi:cytochrome c2